MTFGFVVIATGLFNIPARPDWASPSAVAASSFKGQLVDARDFTDDKVAKVGTHRAQYVDTDTQIQIHIHVLSGHKTPCIGARIYMFKLQLRLQLISSYTCLLIGCSSTQVDAIAGTLATSDCFKPAVDAVAARRCKLTVVPVPLGNVQYNVCWMYPHHSVVSAGQTCGGYWSREDRH